MNPKRPTKRIKGQGGLFRGKQSSYWQMSYWNGWHQVRESARTADRKEALEILQQRLSEAAQRKGGCRPRKGQDQHVVYAAY